MSIAMISEHASPLAALGGVDAGGQNVHVAQLAAALVRLGHQVRVYTRRDDPELPPVVHVPDGYSVEHVPVGPAEAVPKDELLPYMGPFGDFLLRRWHRPGFEPDVVHAHFWMSGVAALRATQRRARPFVVTYHALGAVKKRMQGPADTSPPGRVGLERQVGLAAARIIAQCSDEVAELRRYGLPTEKTTVIPSGVDTSVFTPAPAGSPGSRRPARVVSVGRLVPRKGFADLIAAMPALPGVELVIVGGPPAAALDAEPEAVRLLELATRLGVRDRVTLLGGVPQAQMPALYRSADVVACTPDYEPFGITPLEAMSCQVPVVAYAVGGLIDSVRDGVTGALVPPRDVPALAAALGHLLGDPARRAAYGRMAGAIARDRYTWQHTAHRLATVYGQVVAAERYVDAAVPARFL
ncbi:glycosyltransferase [Catellatospora sp. KI3]|uniref:glycosyltransferase n=1 Tax=Catellatospora sp. KI3 TaxID=3041620 RepID=UPI00248231D6|nr:glycosyltransferase [Catellatospora sp. KI3]MDI1460693.1 glycosyltransferase [Catellatospora sp. KI3]